MTGLVLQFRLRTALCVLGVDLLCELAAFIRVDRVCLFVSIMLRLKKAMSSLLRPVLGTAGKDTPIAIF